MTNTPPDTGIALTTKYVVLAFLLFFFKPKAHIDGGPPIAVAWGRTFFPLEPGTHTVRCYVPYLFYRFMGDSSATVEVAPGRVLEVRWRSPWLVFLKGNFSLAG